MGTFSRKVIEALMQKIQRRFAWVLLLVAFSAVQANGQGVPEEDRATLAFDIDVERFHSSEIVDALGIDRINQLFSLDFVLPQGIELAHLSRIRGMFRLDGTMGELITLRPEDGGLPMSFMVQIQGASDEFLETFRETATQGTRLIEEGGKTYYAPPEPAGGQLANGPVQNLRIYFEGDSVTIGTADYVSNSDSELMSKELRDIWKSIPSDNLIRVAFDVESSRVYVKDFLAESADSLFTQQSPFRTMVEPILKVQEQMQSIAAFGDLTHQTVLSVEMVGKGETKQQKADGLEQIKGVGDGLLFMASMPLRNVISQIPIKSERGTEALHEMAKQLKMNVREDRVSLVVNKPPQLDEILREDYVPELRKQADLYKVRVNLSTIAAAATLYRRRNNHLVFHHDQESGMSPNLGWQVRLLSCMYDFEANRLIGKCDLERAWDHEANRNLMDKMPRHFGDANNRCNAVWVKSSIATYEEITDPPSETVMVMWLPESRDKPWTQPDHLSVLEAIRVVKALEEGEEILAASYTGKYIRLNRSLTNQQLKAYFTPNAGD